MLWPPLCCVANNKHSPIMHSRDDQNCLVSQWLIAFNQAIKSHTCSHDFFIVWFICCVLHPTLHLGCLLSETLRQPLPSWQVFSNVSSSGLFRAEQTHNIRAINNTPLHCYIISWPNFMHFKQKRRWALWMDHVMFPSQPSKQNTA